MQSATVMQERARNFYRKTINASPTTSMPTRSNLEDTSDVARFYWGALPESDVLTELNRKIQQLQAAVQQLQVEQTSFVKYNFQRVEEADAKKTIVTFLKQCKKGHQISVFELSQSLNLAADQVESVLESLEKEGKVTLSD